MIFTDRTGRPVADLAIGRNHRDETVLVVSQAEARIAIPTDRLIELSDLLCEVAEILDGRGDPVRPYTPLEAD